MKKRESLLRLVSVMLLLYALGHFTQSRLTLRRTEELAEQLQTEYDTLLIEQQSLRERLADLETDEGLEAAARERLGLVRPGELVFRVVDGDGAEPPSEGIIITDREERPWEWKWEAYWKEK